MHVHTKAPLASCVFRQVTCRDSPSACVTFDSVIGAARTNVLFAETRDADGAPCVHLYPVGAADADGARPLVLGHQQGADGLACPATADEQLSTAPSPPRLAAVAVAVDESRSHVLLTRRPRTMRTFPGAWVLPGGSVDASDASVCAGARRELLEEAGIGPAPTDASVVPLCCWESCYPTSHAEWGQARTAGGRCIQHLVVYYMVPVPINSVLKLDPIECDCAVWAPLSEIASLLGGDSAVERVFARAPGVPEGEPISARVLCGVYPNALGEGIARGHLFALSQLVRLAAQSGRDAPLRTSAEQNHL